MKVRKGEVGFQSRRDWRCCSTRRLEASLTFWYVASTNGWPLTMAESPARQHSYVHELLRGTSDA